MPTGTTDKQINSHYQGGALDSVGIDAGYQINEKTKATVGYYHQNGDVGGASGSGATAGLSYDINDNLTAGIKVSYDDTFETRVMATINYTFSNLFKSDEEEKEATPNVVINALSTSPEQRDIRVNDALTRCARSMALVRDTPEEVPDRDCYVPDRPAGPVKPLGCCAPSAPGGPDNLSTVHRAPLYATA